MSIYLSVQSVKDEFFNGGEGGLFDEMKGLGVEGLFFLHLGLFVMLMLWCFG